MLAGIRQVGMLIGWQISIRHVGRLAVLEGRFIG